MELNIPTPSSVTPEMRRLSRLLGSLGISEGAATFAVLMTGETYATNLLLDFVEANKDRITDEMVLSEAERLAKEAYGIQEQKPAEPIDWQKMGVPEGMNPDDYFWADDLETDLMFP